MKIVDLAKIVGVSPATISNALNNKKGISIEQRDKILEIAKIHGYKKKSNLKDTKKIIKFLIFKNSGLVFEGTPFFSSLIEGVEKEAFENGFDLVITHISENSSSKIPELVNKDEVQGVILLGTELFLKDLHIVDSIKKPFVVLDSYFKPFDYNFVVIDNSGGIRKAFDYLRLNGHSKIGYLKSSVYISNFYYRHKEYKDCMEEHNLIINPNYTYTILSTLDGSYGDMKELLRERIHDLPTAFIADNDIIALGAMQALTESGIKVPDEVSIIGFDDIPFSGVSFPKLTTIKVYKTYFGKLAIKRLLDIINNNDSINIKIEVETQLVERNSVKKIFF